MKTALPLLLVLIGSLVAGCGVDFSNPPPGTEFFKKLTITGDLRAGSTITATVSIDQHNPVNVDVKCTLRHAATPIATLATATVAAKPDGGPTATPVASTYSFKFTVDEPGSYNVKCVTPSDVDNLIVKGFNVASGG